MAGSRFRIVLAVAGLAVVAGLALLVAGILADNRALLALAAALLVLAAAGVLLLALRYARAAAARSAGAQEELRRLQARLDQLGLRMDRDGNARREERWQLRHDVIRDTTALLTLHGQNPPAGETVPLTSWSALPASMVLLAQYVRELPAFSTVVELGSGASTLWMALEAKRRDAGIRIVSLEHDADFAEVTRRALERNGVAGLVELRVVGLEPLATRNGEQQWYAPSAWEGLEGIGLLFVDGPPGTTGPLARYPAVEALGARMAAGGLVVLDDTDRKDEQAAAEAWLALERPGGAPRVAELRERTTVIRLP